MSDEPIYDGAFPVSASSIEDLLCQAVGKGAAPMIHNISTMVRAGLGWRGMTAELRFALSEHPQSGVGITITIEPLDLTPAAGGTGK